MYQSTSEAEAICANFGGLFGKCNWDYLTTASTGAVFGVAGGLTNLLPNIPLGYKPDMGKPFSVVVVTSLGTQELSSDKYQVIGDTVVLTDEDTKNLIRTQRVNTNPSPSVTVTYFARSAS